MPERNNAPSIVVIGSVCIDTNTTEKGETYIGWGGTGPYSALAARKLGVGNVTIAASYGPDFTEYGKGFNLMPGPIEGVQTLAYTNVTTQAGRIQTCHNAEAAGPPKFTKRLRKLIKRADILVVAPLVPWKSIDYIIELVRATSDDAVSVLCPQGYFRDIQPDGSIQPRTFSEHSSILSLFDLIILSREDTPNAVKAASSWIQGSSETDIIVTEAEKGAKIILPRANGTQEYRQVGTTAIAPEDVRDSVGCGDFFAMATAIAYWGNGGNIDAAVAEGNRAAGEKLAGSFAAIA